MRVSVLLAVLPLLFGCGDAVSGAAPRPAAPHRESAVVSAPRVERGTPALAATAAVDDVAAEAARAIFANEPMPSDPIGHLVEPQSLRHLYEALALLEDGHTHDDVRIMQYGDSHTAADLGTGEMRRELQARFGDGGRGFVSIGRPWPKYPYAQDGVRTGATPDFHAEKGKSTRAGFEGDGCYGLLGIAVDTDQAGRAWTETTRPASRLELSYLTEPNGGSFDVLIDHAKVAHIDATTPEKASAWRAFDAPDAPHTIEVDAAGNGDVRLFGVTLDRASAGVQVDALGINGAQIYNALTWNEAHMAEQLRHRAPDLVVLAYGTNESLNDTPAAAYEEKLADLLGRFVRAVPTASCLLLGPVDRASKGHDGKWKSAPKVEEIIASQRRVAAAAGCAFYDQLAAMGGPGTIDAWAQEEPPRARHDRVHLMRTGYEELARGLVKDLLTAYGVWRADNGLAPASAPPRTAPLAPMEGAPPTTTPSRRAPPPRGRGKVRPR